MMSFIYLNYLVVAKSSFNPEPHVSLMSFANICKCVLVCAYCVWICMCFCGGIEMVVIRESGFE